MCVNTSFQLLQLPEHGDMRGNMCVVEGERDIPFPIQRIFYDFHTEPSEIRGNHANLYSRFAFISLAGSCEIEVDDGEQKACFLLDDPHKLLVVERMTWKIMRNFSVDHVLLVLSDRHYDPDEYIRNYEDFCRLVKQEGEGLI